MIFLKFMVILAVICQLLVEFSTGQIRTADLPVVLRDALTD